MELHKRIADRFIPAFCKAASTLTVGPGRSETPVFMGPLINRAAVDAALQFQSDLIARGGRTLVQSTEIRTPHNGAFVTPGVIQVDRFAADHDCEVFGPIVQIALVSDLDDAIAQANATQYGLAASIFTASRDTFETFFHQCRSGCINWNSGTAGASGKLPFGGVGHSGNHRPAGAFAVDYCAYPVANMVDASADVTVPAGMLWEDRWL